MIDIIGNIKIDESRQERLDNFVATLLSFEFLCQSGANMYIAMDGASDRLRKMCNEHLAKKLPVKFYFNSQDGGYGYTVRRLISESFLAADDRPFYIQFEEDHFCEQNSIKYMLELIAFMRTKTIQVCRASFHAIEVESARSVTANKTIDPDIGSYFEMNFQNHQDFQKTWPRFYIGTNCIFSKKFAFRLFDKEGTRPHEYELARYNDQFNHRCLVPAREILRSLDDDHGLPGSSMVLKPSEKYKKIMPVARKIVSTYFPSKAVHS